MSFHEERQKLEREIIQTMRDIQSSSPDAIERITLMVVLIDLQDKLEDLEKVNDYFDP